MCDFSTLEDLRDFGKEEREAEEKKRASDARWAEIWARAEAKAAEARERRAMQIEHELDRPTDMDALMDDDSGELQGQWEEVLSD